MKSKQCGLVLAYLIVFFSVLFSISGCQSDLSAVSEKNTNKKESDKKPDYQQEVLPVEVKKVIVGNIDAS